MPNDLLRQNYRHRHLRPCGDKDLSLFKVNPDIPVGEALEHASNLFYYAKKLMLDAAMEPQGERYAWPAYYLCEMGKAVVDDLSQALLPEANPR
ncbi:hypothetical protein PBOI14_28740 [Pseudomonas sp. Boi14]|nr:hypothetical protein PBOI14_28740 [Pseudomonas sp. Boi14]